MSLEGKVESALWQGDQHSIALEVQGVDPAHRLARRCRSRRCRARRSGCISPPTTPRSIPEDVA